jgi:hypothetical protein
MNPVIKRAIFRWIHIVFGFPIIGYVYSPFDKIPQYAPAVRLVFLPTILLSGLWLWKGHLVSGWFVRAGSGVKNKLKTAESGVIPEQ